MGEKDFGFCVPGTAVDGYLLPFFEVIGSKARDVFEGYVLGVFNLGLKAKTEYGVEFHSNLTSNRENGMASGAIETKYNGNGFVFGEKWNTDNVLSGDLTFKDVCQGAKVSFSMTENMEAGDFTMAIKSDYRCENLAFNLGAEFKSLKPTVNGALAVGNDTFRVGYATGFKSEETEFPTHKLAAEYADKEFTIAAGLEEFENLSLSLYHKTTADLDSGLQVKFVFSDEQSNVNVGLGFKYIVDPNFSVRFKVDSAGTLGLSLFQKVQNCVFITLSSLIDVKDPYEGQHKLGFGLLLEV